jgi:hypothetical protein
MQAKETVDMKHKLSSSSQQLEATGLTPEQSLIGVRPDSNGRFLACLTICSHSLQLGVYDSEAQAVKARDVFALALFGPDAVTNAPADHYIPVEVAAMRQQLLREQQQQSQASLSCSPCFASEPAPVAAVKTAPAPATAEAAAYDALQEGPTAALPAHVVAQPAVGSKRPHSRSSNSQEAATGAPAAADSLQEKSPEQPQPAGAANGSPSCKRHKPTPAAVLPQPADARADHGTGQQQQTQTQQMQAMSAAAAGKQQTSLAGSQTAAADAAGTRTGLQEQCMAAADGAAHHHQKQQQGAAGFHQPEDPGMLSGLLCLIEAAASLPAEEQAVLLPAHTRRSNLGSSSAAQHPNQPQDHKGSKEHKEWQPSMATQQCADGLGRVPASCSVSAAAQGTFLQAPASSQQAPASHSLAGTAVQGQQAAAMHQAQQLQQQQQQAGQLAGVEEALQFLQSDAGQSAVQQMELEFKQQQAHDWHDFLQSSSAQQGLHSLQKLFQTTCTTAQQQRQQPQQAQQKHYLQSGSHQLPASHQYSAAAGHAAQQQQQFGRFFAVPPSIPTAGQQLDPMQWLQQQKQQGRPNAPGQPASKMTSLQRALAGASNLPAAATAGAAPLAQQQQQQQLKPRRSNDGAEPHLLSRGSSGHSDGSTYRSSRSPSPDDLDAAAAAAGGEAGRGRSVSADSSSGAAAAAAAAAASGADVLAAMHAAAAAAAAGMHGAGGGYADEEEAYAVGMYGAGMTGQYGAGAAAAEVGFDVLGGELGGTGSRHSARPKRPTERMQEMQQQMQQQHKQRKGKQQEQQQWDGQLQDFFAAWGGAGLPGQFAQLLFQQQQSQEQPWVPQRQQQQLKKKRVNLAWKPASGKASGTDRGDAAAAAAGAGSAADGDLAAAAEGGELPAPVMKVTGPGCVSHAQNPTGQMGVRMRKNRYEAFIAVPPFRYLYLGQHATPADAVRTRDTAMLAIFGPEAAAAHGSAWLSPGAAESIAADEVAALAAKLMKKEQAAAVMKQHGTFGVRHQAGQAGVVPAAAAAAAPVGAAYEEAAAAAVV